MSVASFFLPYGSHPPLSPQKIVEICKKIKMEQCKKKKNI